MASPHSLLCRNIAAVVGIVLVLRLLLKQVWQLLGGFCAFFLAPWGISRINLKKYGPWAGGQASSHVSFHCWSDSHVSIPPLIPVVTGASEGIGRGYALEVSMTSLCVAVSSVTHMI